MKLAGHLSRGRRFEENTVFGTLKLRAHHIRVWNRHCGPSLTSKLLCSCVPFPQFTYLLFFFILTVRQCHSAECDGQTVKNIRTEMNKKKKKRRSGPVASDEQKSANLFRNFET
jgi:hypothetical protein